MPPQSCIQYFVVPDIPASQALDHPTSAAPYLDNVIRILHIRPKNISLSCHMLKKLGSVGRNFFFLFIFFIFELMFDGIQECISILQE